MYHSQDLVLKLMAFSENLQKLFEYSGNQFNLFCQMYCTW